MSSCYAVVWFDRCEARVFQVTSQDSSTRHLSSLRRSYAIPDAAARGSGDGAAARTSVFEAIAAAMGKADDWVIAGLPGRRHEFLAWLGRTWPTLLRRVTVVWGIDDPTDGALLMLAMHPNPAAEHQAAA
jgi:hypothetical protein